eukprot:752821-Hanusia_phi.AAC.1
MMKSLDKWTVRHERRQMRARKEGDRKRWEDPLDPAGKHSKACRQDRNDEEAQTRTLGVSGRNCDDCEDGSVQVMPRDTVAPPPPPLSLQPLPPLAGSHLTSLLISVLAIVIGFIAS